RYNPSISRNMKLPDLYRNCVTTFHLSQERFALTKAPVSLIIFIQNSYPKTEVDNYLHKDKLQFEL
ncbi:hypothetical protein, partial [Psychrobacillus insolitus]|uniref:hypothetical protein n=1 Tax=Psychrobacillus insolitus TaxID=1461 RepID=UPI001B860F3C